MVTFHNRVTKHEASRYRRVIDILRRISGGKTKNPYYQPSRSTRRNIQMFGVCPPPEKPKKLSERRGKVTSSPVFSPDPDQFQCNLSERNV